MLYKKQAPSEAPRAVKAFEAVLAYCQHLEHMGMTVNADMQALQVYANIFLGLYELHLHNT